MNPTFISDEMEDLQMKNLQAVPEKLGKEWRKLMYNRREVLEKLLPHLTNADVINAVTDILLTGRFFTNGKVPTWLISCQEDNMYDLAVKSFMHLVPSHISDFGSFSMPMHLWNVRKALESLEQ